VIGDRLVIGDGPLSNPSQPLFRFFLSRWYMQLVMHWLHFWFCESHLVHESSVIFYISIYIGFWTHAQKNSKFMICTCLKFFRDVLQYIEILWVNILSKYIITTLRSIMFFFYK